MNNKDTATMPYFKMHPIIIGHGVILYAGPKDGGAMETYFIDPALNCYLING